MPFWVFYWWNMRNASWCNRVLSVTLWECWIYFPLIFSCMCIYRYTHTHTKYVYIHEIYIHTHKIYIIYVNIYIIYIFFLSLNSCFHIYVLISSLLNIPVESTVDLWCFLSVQFSAVQYCLLQTQAVLVLLVPCSELGLSARHRQRDFPLSISWPGNSFKPLN